MQTIFRHEVAAGIGPSPIIITGAGGWLGRAALEMFSAAVPLAQIFAFGSTARVQTLRDGRMHQVQELAALPALAAPGAIIFHTAFVTLEHVATQPLAAYEAANRGIADYVEDFIRRQAPRGVFVPSSGLAHTADAVRNPYGAAKLADEQRFAALGAALRFAVVNMRVFNLAGPFINKLESYALACILRDLLADRAVSLRAAHPVIRGYAHVADVLSIALGLILRGESPPVFDTWGQPIELSALAERAAALLGKELRLVRPDWQDGAANRYVGSAEAYLAHAAALGIEPAGLDRQILDTADYLGRCLAI